MHGGLVFDDGGSYLLDGGGVASLLVILVEQRWLWASKVEDGFFSRSILYSRNGQ